MLLQQRIPFSALFLIYYVSSYLLPNVRSAALPAPEPLEASSNLQQMRSKRFSPDRVMFGLGKRLDPNNFQLGFGKRWNPQNFQMGLGKRLDPANYQMGFGKRQLDPSHFRIGFGKRFDPGNLRMGFGKRFDPTNYPIGFGKKWDWDSTTPFEDDSFTSGMGRNERALTEPTDVVYLVPVIPQ